MKIKSRLYHAYSNLSVVKKSIIWYTAATMLQKGLVFLTTPIYTRMLSDTQYGLYSVYQSWLQIISVVAVVALDRCMTVGFMKYESDRAGFLSSVQLLMTVTVGASLAFVLVFHSFFTQIFDLQVHIIIAMFIVALLSNTTANWSWYKRYEYHYKELAVFTVAAALATQLVSILCVLFFPAQNKGEVLILSTTAATVVLYGVVYAAVFVKGKVGYKKSYWSFSFPYSVKIVPHALAQIVLNSSDRIMIDKICGRSDAAYYGVTYSAAMILNILMISVSSAIQPTFFEKIKNKDFKGIRRITNRFIMLPAVLSVAVSLFAPEILMILAPASYQSAVWIFPSVAMATFFNALYLCFANFESYYEKPVYFSIATVTGAAANIILNLIFIPIFGFAAAGYTTLACYILFSVMHYFFMVRVCKEKLNSVRIFDLKFIIGLSSLVVFLSVGVTAIYPFAVLRYIVFILGVVVCFFKRNRIMRWVKE